MPAHRHCRPNHSRILIKSQPEIGQGRIGRDLAGSDGERVPIVFLSKFVKFRSLSDQNLPSERVPASGASIAVEVAAGSSRTGQWERQQRRWIRESCTGRARIYRAGQQSGLVEYDKYRPVIIPSYRELDRLECPVRLRSSSRYSTDPIICYLY